MRSKEVEESIEKLKNFDDGYTFQQCQTCFKFNEKDSCCNKEKCEELQAIDTVLNYIAEKEKEYEYEKDLRLKYERRYDLLKEGSISKHKIRDKIKDIEKQIKGEKANKYTIPECFLILHTLEEILGG